MNFLILLLLLLRLAIGKPRYQGSLDHQSPRSPPLYSNEDTNIFPIDLRSINDYKLSDYLLISDIDGNLHNVDRNSGLLVWSLPFEEPLIHIEANNSHHNSHEQDSDSDESNILWFVEPYNDGTLYYFTPEFGLNKLPATIKELVLQSPFSLAGDDKIYTGTRKTSLYTLNIHTGEIISQFGDDKCPTSTYQDTSTGGDSDYMMIGKTVYELTIHSKSDSNIVWYVTYSQWGPNNIDNDLIIQNQKSLDELYFTPFHDKSLLAINKELGTPIWISKLPLLAVNVFDIFNNKKLDDNFVILPHPLKVLNDLQINQDDGTINNDLCFINKTADSDQWFAMSFINYPTLIKSAPISQYQMALFKVDNNYYDMPHLSTLRHLKLHDIGNDYLINGIHKIHHLSSDTMYQPVSKFSQIFDRLSIDDGKDEDVIPQKTSTNMAIPNIIEGIRFQSSSHNEILPTSPKEDFLLIESTDKSEYLPQDYYDTANTTSKTDSLSLMKKICEDIIVILVMSLFLLALTKSKLVFRKVRNFYESLEVRIEINKDTDLKRKIEFKFSNERGKVLEESEESGDESKEGSHTSTDTLVQGSKDTLVQGSKELQEHSKDSLNKKVTITTPEDSSGHEDDEDSTKKKRKRGGRGGKRGNKKKSLDQSDGQEITELGLDNSSGPDNIISTTSLVKMTEQNKTQAKKLQIENNLLISDKILGYGSHGTVVYQGTFENRPVAVKRMLLDFYDVANHEVSLLQQSDDHPNVIRYFCSQSSLSEKFLYIALELCQGSLDDLVERNKFNFKPKPDNTFNLNHLLYQLANGLNYLHKLKIVHRDLKPQNILIGDFRHKVEKPVNQETNSIDEVRLLISDFGLCKKLDHDQSSFRATSQNAASGTSGWRAPELLLNHELLEISPDTISSIGSNTSGATSSNTSSTNVGNKRLTKSIDIFSLGCVFFYILSGGRHPFGDRYSREGNIIKGQYELALLDRLPDKVELKHLIGWMIDLNPSGRPNTSQILKHPYFWTKSKKLEFLLKVSDRFEIESRDPPSELLQNLEKASLKVTARNWHRQFDEEFMNNLGKYRKYHTEKLMDLLRALRNKYHHFNDMPANLQHQMTPLPDSFYNYFSTKFPNLLMEVYFVIEKDLKHEHVFQEYY